MYTPKSKAARSLGQIAFEGLGPLCKPAQQQTFTEGDVQGGIMIARLGGGSFEKGSPSVEEKKRNYTHK